MQHTFLCIEISTSSHVLCLTLLSYMGSHLLFNLNIMTNFCPDFHPVFVAVKIMVMIQLKVPVAYQDFQFCSSFGLDF